MSLREKVWAVSCADYDRKNLREALAEIWEIVGWPRVEGLRVLVKPNLVAARRASLSCTHPEVVRVVCEYLVDSGAEVTVGDSPAFGTARSVARASGLLRALADLPVKFTSFTPGPPVRLVCGVTVRLAREALCADLIVNLPRFKAHDQLLLTLAVKNLFGCVVGWQKPLLHVRLGEKRDLFFRMILEIQEFLPVGLNVVDAVVAMEERGPTTGNPRPLGYLFASRNAVALDTALYQALGLSPGEVPLWRTAQGLRLFGARIEEVEIPSDFPNLSSFRPPRRLSPVTFHPWRLLRGLTKRLLLRLVRF